MTSPKQISDGLSEAQENLDLALKNWPFPGTPLDASKAYMELTSMYSHRGDGIPTQYRHSPEVAEQARILWSALITALRARGEG